MTNMFQMLNRRRNDVYPEIIDKSKMNQLNVEGNESAVEQHDEQKYEQKLIACRAVPLRDKAKATMRGDQQRAERADERYVATVIQKALMNRIDRIA